MVTLKYLFPHDYGAANEATLFCMCRHIHAHTQALSNAYVGIHPGINLLSI